MNLSSALSQLRIEEKDLKQKLAQFKHAIAVLKKLGLRPKRRKLSPEAKRRIAAAQKKRWAEWKRKNKK